MRWRHYLQGKMYILYSSSACLDKPLPAKSGAHATRFETIILNAVNTCQAATGGMGRGGAGWGSEVAAHARAAARRQVRLASQA